MKKQKLLPMWILDNQTTSYLSHQIKFLLKVDRSVTLGDSLSPRWVWGFVDPGGAFDLVTNAENDE